MLVSMPSFRALVAESRNPECRLSRPPSLADDEHELLTENEDPERTHTEQIMPAKLDYNREYYARLKRGQWTVWGDIPRLRVCDAAYPAVACPNTAQPALFPIMQQASAA